MVGFIRTRRWKIWLSRKNVKITENCKRAICIAFTSGYKHKFAYFMRTINYISCFMSPVEKIIEEKLIPAWFDGSPISVEFRKLLALPFKLGGMGIIGPTKNVNDEYNSPSELISQLANSTKQQRHRYTVSDENIKNCKSSIQKKRKDKNFSILNSLQEKMSSKAKDSTILLDSKAAQTDLLCYLLNNLDNLSKPEF